MGLFVVYVVGQQLFRPNVPEHHRYIVIVMALMEQQDHLLLPLHHLHLPPQHHLLPQITKLKSLGYNLSMMIIMMIIIIMNSGHWHSINLKGYLSGELRGDLSGYFVAIKITTTITMQNTMMEIRKNIIVILQNYCKDYLSN